MLFVKVLTEGRLILEFTFDDLMRIRSWSFFVHRHEEFISRSVLQTDPNFMDEQAKNITIKGMTSNTLTLLNVRVLKLTSAERLVYKKIRKLFLI